MSTLNKIQHHLKRHQIKLGQLLASHGASEYTILIIYSIILGTIAGLAAVGFHETIFLISEIIHIEKNSFFSNYGWIIIFIPVFGMFLQWVMVRMAPRASKQRGVLEIIKAVSLRDGIIPFRTTLFHFLAPAICIGTGGTVGPEAPAAQTGAGIVSATGRLLGLSESRLRMFTAAGAGAAIAGVFNTPLAGIFFSLEVVLLNEFRATALSVFLLSSVSASAVSRIFLGNDPKFVFNVLNIGPYSQFLFYLLLGVSAGLLSIFFIKSKEFIKSKFDYYYRTHNLLTGMLITGLLMGIAGFLFPEIFGIGYNNINNILSDSLNVQFIILLFFLKFILVILILGSGGFGGIFAPSIFMGACYGYFFAYLMSVLFNLHLDPTTYTLVGMGAMLAGINSVPITAIMILFEMTNNYLFILPLILGIVGSHTITQMVMNGSIYRNELTQEGYRISDGKESTILRSIPVEKITKTDILTIPESTPVSELIRRFLSEEHDTIYTINVDGNLSGVITSGTLHHLITSYHNLHGVVIAKDIADTDFVAIDAKDNLEIAMRLFAKYPVEELPVLQHENRDKILGTLHYQDVLNLYNQKIGKLSIKDELAINVKSLDTDNIMEAIPGFSIAEVEIPEKFINKNLAHLNLRNRYKIDVLMIERSRHFEINDATSSKIMPDKNYILS
ncbi:chloride channel protein, partial [candidate division KSB1 bacterium]|nr:chloride channel protein [candidate division KSB1 bacterium]